MKQVYSLSCALLFFCLIFSSVKVSAQVSVSISSQTNISCNGGNDGAAVAVQSGGIGPFSFVWMPGNISNDTASALFAGSYTVTVTDSSDMSTAMASCAITQPSALGVSCTSFSVLCHGGTSGQANASVSGGTAPYTYAWSPYGGTAATAMGLSAQTYTCAISDANGCVITQTIVVTEPAPLIITMSITPIYCNGGTGQATANVTGGVNPYNYSWSPSGGVWPTTTGLTAGCYTCTVTDMNGCVTAQQACITQPPVIVIQTTSTSPSSCLACDASASVTNVIGGTAPYTYHWSIGNQTTQTAVNVCQGLSRVIVTDAYGCIDSAIVNVIGDTSFIASVSTVNSGCISCTGTATANSSGGQGPFTYLWTNNSTNQTITNQCPGSCSVIITDASGCITSDTATIGFSVSFNASTSVTNPLCGNNFGSITANITGGVPPYTYLWTPGNFTSQTIAGPPGIYHVALGDQSGCSTSLYDTILFAPHPNCFITGHESNCAVQNGTLVVHPNSGTPPYTFLWSTNSTNDTISGLTGGNYSVQVTDSVGCVTAANYTLYTACDNIIQGKIYDDPNGNCIFDQGDTPGFGLAYVTPGNYGASANASGDYEIRVPLPGSYVVHYSNWQGNYAIHCPNTWTYNASFTGLGDTLFNDDFGLHAVSIQDLSVYFNSSIARPGDTVTYNLYYQNAGTVPVSNCGLLFNHDPILTFISSSLPPSSYNNPNLFWSMAMLTPGQSGTIVLKFLIPTIGNGGCLGCILQSCAYIQPLTGDVQPWNNTYCDQRSIQGAFDPNYKTANSASMDFDGNIPTNDSILTYTIYFQNTGTDTAFNIFIVDTLSSYLDASTIYPGPSSGNCQFEITNGQMKFSLINILLPDSNSNEPASHGFVSYRIKTNNGLVPGTPINNTAYIFFDTNPAIVTNTTSDTIISPLSVQSQVKHDIISVYPNPFNQSTTIILPSSISGKQNEIILTDLQGRIVRRENIRSTDSYILEKENLEPGIYFCTVKSEGQIIGNVKLIVQ